MVQLTTGNSYGSWKFCARIGIPLRADQDHSSPLYNRALPASAIPHYLHDNRNMVGLGMVISIIFAGWAVSTGTVMDQILTSLLAWTGV